MYLRDHGIRGSQKIQDLWSSVVHQVVRAPTGDGVVYNVAPTSDPGRTRNVHRDMLKAVVQPKVVALPSPTSPSLPPPVASLDDSSNSDLWLLVSEVPAPCMAMPPPVGTPQASSALAETGPQSACSSTAPATSMAPSPTVRSADQPCSSQQSLRRTARPTAGSHSNMHHLPRSVNSQEEASNWPADSASNSLMAVFRPWC